MAKDLLLEIGTEEVPAHFMPGILAQLKEKATAKFQEMRLDFDEVTSLGTPRRTALLVKNLAETQQGASSEYKGPSTAIAFDKDGNPTKAAIGFARGKKVDVADLVVKDGYVYAVSSEEGKQTVELLPTLLKELVEGLNFPKNMRWGDLDFRFVRPLRWLVALYDEEVIDFTVANVTSGRVSRGHRFLSEGDFTINKASDYEQACKDAFIIVDQEKRRDIIKAQIEEIAKAHNGHAEITEDLLEEVIYLVEYPTALCGTFEDKYLKLPKEAVMTPMRDHQRYFPVLDDNNNLLPLFITVRNGGDYCLDKVQHGNERVLRARLADAQFFFDEDRKHSLYDYVEKLKTVVFQEGLGTIYDKANRLAELSAFIGEKVNATEDEIKTTKRAAILAKADLVSAMVCEFTELQGIMGREYALLDGEGQEVATAIYEHYMPRFAGDAEPASVAGRLVSLADKMDNIVATFSRGLVPTGSQDPFALRRQALGIVHTIIEANYTISISEIADKAMDLLNITDSEKRAEIQKNVAEFFTLRLKNVLSDNDVRYDIIDAVLENADEVAGTYAKACVTAQEIASGVLNDAIQAFVRVGNISKKAENNVINEALFTLDEEKALYNIYVAVAKDVETALNNKDYKTAIDKMQELTAPINNFFDNVMVMDKDEQIKNNRLALLKNIDTLIKSVADFGKIVL
ncbi:MULTISPECIES: glycine--tRNA ligase subunit beta [Megamonas]|jgi:glycyl-tRNA synthetase beta chain|uniref:Glycine--tRNA ligase beta subunit n=1 Tax=Megamonas funiformis TaxID=437897 RepID=A0AAW4TZR9_9FIRM|nr:MULTISPECIES: glycine--tRNA ligase subunit beta [Megamonas]MBD9296355.1 glycine--tRNA ligase subunit beta [Megamonas funiformis]MCB6827779.1 glycine--tRNA ligase subunit beta [Megamonas funiformis]